MPDTGHDTGRDTGRRIVSLWFPRLASDRVLRRRPVDAPFALTLKQANADRLHCLNARAEAEGLNRGMTLADARAFCPGLVSRPAQPDADARFLQGLRRWATRYAPWVGRDGADGLVLDATGTPHLWGGESPMLADMRARAARAGLEMRIGLAGSRGGAWALARFAEGIAAPGTLAATLAPLPAAALRLDADTATALERLGLSTVGALAAAPRAPLARRFGAGLMLRLDQALGLQPEPVTPEAEPPHYATRLTLPEPIGRTADVMAAAERLLAPLCAKLAAHEAGARRLTLTLRRVDQASRQVELRLAGPMRDPARILPLFERGVAEVDAGYGIDQIRLHATQVEPLPLRQTGRAHGLGDHSRARGLGDPDRLNDLISRIGTRIGLDNIHRFHPADSHIPERAFLTLPAAYSRPEGTWHSPRPRPLRLFPPEAVAGAPATAHPPARFRWRRMALTTARATGPERLAPEWWLSDEAWRGGLRDYWRVETREGRRLWLFHTPENPGWFVQGEFA